LKKVKNVRDHKRKHEVPADQVNDLYDIPLGVAEKRDLIIKRDGVFMDPDDEDRYSPIVQIE